MYTPIANFNIETKHHTQIAHIHNHTAGVLDLFIYVYRLVSKSHAHSPHNYIHLLINLHAHRTHNTLPYQFQNKCVLARPPGLESYGNARKHSDLR